MRKIFLVGLGLLVAGCNQTAQTPGPVASASGAGGSEALPPIYEPLVDMHRVNPEKYRRDLAECRQQAAPQEAVARKARDQQVAGTALAVAGAAASFIPVSSFRQAHTLANATSAAQSAGGTIAEGGAITAEQATADYALVVNTCLTHRRYRLLRG